MWHPENKDQETAFKREQVASQGAQVGGHGAVTAPGLHTLPPGLTKREWFAGMAMQGILASEVDCPSCSARFDTCAEYAAKHADALIAELGREG